MLLLLFVFVALEVVVAADVADVEVVVAVVDVDAGLIDHPRQEPRNFRSEPPLLPHCW